MANSRRDKHRFLMEEELIQASKNIWAANESDEEDILGENFDSVSNCIEEQSKCDQIEEHNFSEMDCDIDIRLQIIK